MSTEWTFLLADLLTNTVFGEVPMAVDAVSLKLNTSGTLTGKLPIRQIPGDPYRYTTPGRSCVYVIRNGEPWWGGIIWTRAYSSGTGIIELGCSDWWTYYSKRFIYGPSDPANKTVPPFAGDPPGQFGTTDTYTAANGFLEFGGSSVKEGQYEAKTQVAIIRALLAHCAKYTGGDIRMHVLGPPTDTYTRTRVYANKDLTTYGQALTDLTGIDANGPDLMFGVNGWDGNAPRRCLFVGGPFLTHGAEGLVWEFGGNMLSYQWASDASGEKLSTRTWQKRSDDAAASGALMARADNVDRIRDGWPILETKLADVKTFEAPKPEDVAALAQAGADQRALPTVIPALTVRTDRPPYLNFAPGDYARLHIRDEYFREPMTTDVRVVALTANLVADTAQIDVNPVFEDVT